MMETNDKQLQRVTANQIRLAVVAAIKAGNYPDEIKSIVADTLFGIQHFGIEYIENDATALLAAAGVKRGGEMNTTLDNLFDAIENGLDNWNLAADGQTADDNYQFHAQTALAELRKQVADLEAERDNLKALAETQAEIIALVNKTFKPGIIES